MSNSLKKVNIHILEAPNASLFISLHFTFFTILKGTVKSLIEYILCSGTFPLCPCPQGSSPVSHASDGKKCKDRQSDIMHAEGLRYRMSDRQTDTHREKR